MVNQIKMEEQKKQNVQKSWWQEIYDSLMEFVATYNDSYDHSEE